MVCFFHQQVILLKEKTIMLDGHKIRYLESERVVLPSDKHMLFIHGLGSSADRWMDIPDALSRYFHTIAVDLIGFGGSDKPITINYTVKKLQEFIVDFIAHIGIDDGKTSLIGHSLGGYIAAEVAIENSKKGLIEKLVLVDSSGMLEKPTPLLQQYLDAAINTSYDKVKSVFEQLVAQRWRIIPILIDYFIMRINLPGARYAFGSAYHNSTTTQIGLERLKLIEAMPVLIIWGKNDNLIPVEHLKLFKKVLEDAHLEIIEDAGHAPFSEKPAIVSEILHAFLS